jgi:hypothetical protein
MGVTWDEREKLAFAMLVVPDGRIVCQRPAQPSPIKLWQATAYRKISRYFMTSKEASIDCADLILSSLFNIHLPLSNYTHFLSHYEPLIGKRLEIVMCKLPSPAKIEVTKFTEVRFFNFEGLVAEIDKNRDTFAPHTISAVNVLNELWRGEACSNHQQT